MAVYNVELRRSNGTNYEDRIFIKTSVGLVEGLLEANGKIKASLLPSFVFGSMRFVTSISNPQMTTAEIQDIFGEFIDANGGTMRGCYAIATNSITIETSTGHTFEGLEEGDIPDPSETFVLEPNDWIIAVDDNGTTWAVINNTYRFASINQSGVVFLATEQDGINGTNTVKAMTPAATVAAINARAYQHPTYTGNDLGAPLTGPKVISDINVNSLGHVTGFATRNLTLADLGFTGASNANYYVHPNMTGMPLNLSLSSLEHISNIQIDEQGHVTAVSKGGIPTADESTIGVVTLASSSEAKGGTNNSKVLTPARAKEMIDKFASIPIVQSLPTDMSDHPAGKLILLQI